MANAPADTWHSEDTKVLQVLASVLANHQRQDKAVLLLEYLLRRDPDNAEIHCALAGAYLLAQQFDRALHSADTALSKAHPAERSQQLRLVKSHALWGLNRPGEAQKVMADYVEKRQAT